jgi:hypothetical protein
VTYGCDFRFPAGLRGRIVQTLLGREVRLGPANSLARLKAAAEAAHRSSFALDRDDTAVAAA